METENARNADSDEGLREAGEVIGIILGFLFFMWVLRCFVNTTIDVTVLRDTTSLIRNLSQIRRLFCPWFHPRTEPEEQLAEPTVRVDTEYRSRGADRRMAQMMEGLTARERYMLLAPLLASKVRLYSFVVIESPGSIGGKILT